MQNLIKKLNFKKLNFKKLNLKKLNLNRGIKILKVGNDCEILQEKSDFPKDKIMKILSNEKISILGFGSQGKAQALNLRDYGFDVMLGLRKGNSYDDAKKSGFIPDKNLYSIEEATNKGTIIMNLLNDAAQKEMWPKMKKYFINVAGAGGVNKTLYFSHGFSITYKEQTNIVPPNYIDVIMVAPKASGLTVRNNFLEKRFVNSSYAVYQNASGEAYNKVFALGFAIGSANLFPTTFEKEVFSDLTGERGILMGLLQASFLAQFNTLRENGHSASEAFNETVEELTQSLIKLVDEKGMQYMYENTSATAQRGAIDSAKDFYKILKPQFEKLYHSVKTGNEAQRILKKNNDVNYRKELDLELKEISNSELWKAGKIIRSLRT